jgi:hypothetical protein
MLKERDHQATQSLGLIPSQRVTALSHGRQDRNDPRHGWRAASGAAVDRAVHAGAMEHLRLDLSVPMRSIESRRFFSHIERAQSKVRVLVQAIHGLMGQSRLLEQQKTLLDLARRTAAADFGLARAVSDLADGMMRAVVAEAFDADRRADLGRHDATIGIRSGIGDREETDQGHGLRTGNGQPV